MKAQLAERTIEYLDFRPGCFNCGQPATVIWMAHGCGKRPFACATCTRLKREDIETALEESPAVACNYCEQRFLTFESFIDPRPI